MTIVEGDGFAALARVVNRSGRAFETTESTVETMRHVVDDLEVPSSFVTLYKDHGPAPGSHIPWVVEDLALFALSELPGAQAGYRWVATDRASAPSPSWTPSWVVVASVFGDPFFIDTSLDPSPVLFARHGAGGWAPKTVAPSMNHFVAALTAFEGVLLDEFDCDVWDEAGLLPDFVRRVAGAVTEVLTGEQAEAFSALLA